MSFGGWRPRIMSEKERIVRAIIIVAGIYIMGFALNFNIYSIMWFMMGAIIFLVGLIPLDVFQS